MDEKTNLGYYPESDSLTITTDLPEDVVEPNREVNNWDDSSQPLTNNNGMGFKKLFVANWHPCLAYCGVFWSFGMCVAFLGPTLLDLGCLTASDLHTISWVFFAQLMCSLVGASLAGYLVQRGVFSASDGPCDANFILLVSSALIPIAMLIIPFCTVLPALALVLGIMGLNMGTIDCLANLQMINVFGENVAPFLQAMHFCYGFGAFVSPMIAEPFLLNEDCSVFVDNKTVSLGSAPRTHAHRGDISPALALDNSLSEVNISSLPAQSLNQAQEMTQVKYAFWIMAATQIPFPLLVATLIARLRMRGITRHHQQLVESDSSQSMATTENGNLKNRYGTINRSEGKGTNYRVGMLHTVVITTATSMMLFLYDGMQSDFGGFVYSYAVKSIAGMMSTEGAYLNASFWGCFSLGRLLSIAVATKLSSAFMLLCNIMGSLFAVVLMLSMPHDHTCLYIGTVMFGLFISSVTPTSISMAEQYIEITSLITSAIVIIGALGEMIFPVIVGNIFQPLGPVSFLWFNLIMCIASVAVFLVLVYTGRQTSKARAKNAEIDDHSWVWCRMCCFKKSQASCDEDPPYTKTLTPLSRDPAAHNGTYELRKVSAKSVDDSE